MMWKGQKRRRCQKKCTVLAQESLLSLTKRTFSCDLLLNTTSPNNNAHPLLNIPARKTSVFFGSLHVHLPQLNSAQRPRKDLSDGTGRWRNLSQFEPIWANSWTKLILTKPLWAKLLGQAMPDLVSGLVQFRLITRKATARGTSQPTGGRIHTLSFLGRIFKNSRGVPLVAIHDHHQQVQLTVEELIYTHQPAGHLILLTHVHFSDEILRYYRIINISSSSNEHRVCLSSGFG